MKNTFLCRGISGSGKSFNANKLREKYLAEGKSVEICSADDYFLNNGLYIFDGSKLKQAHAWCREKFQNAIDSGVDIVIIDNTNTTFWEMRFYIFYSLGCEYQISLVEPITPWAFNPEELLKKNCHGVPIESIERMLKRYEKPKEIYDKLQYLIDFAVNYGEK